MPIFSSLNCNTDERWVEGCQVSEQAGADAIELNVSCPHGTHIMAQVDMLETMAHAVRIAKAATKLPIIPKMSGQLDAPARVAHGLAQAGADGIVMFNRFTGLDIDLETEMPIMHGGYAGHGGPWAIHYVLRWISEISPTLPIPILASGGVAGGDDAVKHLLAGAQAVEVCTAIVMEGWGVVERILKEMADFAEDKGYASVADFRGKVVVMNVFASWCDPCRAEAPILAHEQRVLATQGATIVGVTYLDNSTASEQFVKQEHITYPVLRDVNGTLVRSFGTDAVPETFIINRQGKIQALRRYQLNNTWLKRTLPSILAERS